ncbi:MAG: universal stress protein [Pseudomonadota bacterium]
MSTRPLLDQVQAERDASFRKFLVVVDDSDECHRAMRFACGRAAHTKKGHISLFYAIAPVAFQHWLGVEDVMKEEARQEAEALLRQTADDIYEYVGLTSEYILVEGDPSASLQKHLEADEDIFALVLGAADAESPGPLVEHFCGSQAGRLKCPVVIVPGGLSRKQIDMIV